MKYVWIPFCLFSMIALPAFCELTSDDLLKISEIVNKAVKDSETRMKEYVDLKVSALETNMNTKFESIDKRFDEVGGKINILTAIVCALIGLIGIIIALPFWQNRKDDRDLKKQIDRLIQRIEALENGRIRSS